MKVFAKNFALTGAVLSALATPVFAQGFPTPAQGSAASEKAVVQPASYNGYSCEMVRAKVAESGVTAAYAYARYMGLSHRDITKVRKACAV